MNYNEFINYNMKVLKKNYKSRHKHIFKTHFYEYCKFIWIAYSKGMWLDESYKKGIIFNK